MTNTNQNKKTLEGKLDIQKISKAMEIVEDGNKCIEDAYYGFLDNRDKSSDYLKSVQDYAGKKILRKYGCNPDEYSWSGNLDYVIEKHLGKASEFEKIVAGQYFANNNVWMTLRCSETKNFGYFKDPSTCQNCIDTKDNLYRLGIIQYAECQGDRVYEIPQKTLDDALLSALGLNITRNTVEKIKKYQVNSFQILKTAERSKK